MTAHIAVSDVLLLTVLKYELARHAYNEKTYSYVEGMTSQ